MEPNQQQKQYNQAQPTNAAPPRSDRLAHGTRIGHFAVNSNNRRKLNVSSTTDTNSALKLFNPYGTNKWYKYTPSLVPSVGAGERVAGMYDRGGFRRSDYINTQAGDKNYFNQLINHYNSVPAQYWNNMQMHYDQNSARAYGDMVGIPRAYPKDGKSGAYFTHERAAGPYRYGGGVYIPSTNKAQENNTQYYNRLQNKPWATTSVNSNSTRALLDTTQRGRRGEEVLHELTHEAMYGGADLRAQDPSLKLRAADGTNSVIPTYHIPASNPILVRPTHSFNHDPNSEGNSVDNTLLQYANPNELDRLSRVEKRRLPAHIADNLDPYDMDEAEISQAMISYNRNRNLLANNIRKNMGQYIMAGFNPMHLYMITAQPKFYSADTKGEQQFVNDMEFYSQNPQLAELLGTEGRRAVSTYHNLNREYNRIPSLDRKPQINIPSLPFRGGTAFPGLIKNPMQQQKRQEPVVSTINQKRQADAEKLRQKNREALKPLFDQFKRYRILSNRGTVPTIGSPYTTQRTVVS